MKKKISKIGFMLKSHTLFAFLAGKLSRVNLTCLNDEERELSIAKKCLGYTPDLHNPKTLNEKLIYLKFHYRNTLWQRCADKLAMKGFLEENGFGNYAIKTLGGPYRSSSEIDLDALPEKFVLKTNHDCGSVYVCKKGETDFGSVFKKLDISLKSKYSQRGSNGEWVYDAIQPVIFAEELLEPSEGNDLYDFKFFCFNGVPKFLYVISNRNTDERLNLKNLDYSDIDCIHVMLKNKRLSKTPPADFEEMKAVASALAPKFDFVRIDFFSTKVGPKIGELTFFPTSGHGAFFPRDFDRYFGDQLDISFCNSVK